MRRFVRKYQWPMLLSVQSLVMFSILKSRFEKKPAQEGDKVNLNYLEERKKELQQDQIKPSRF